MNMGNYGMRCHDICPAGPVRQVLDRVVDNGILQIQLAMGKSFTDFDSSYGHYSPGAAHMLKKELDQRDIHVAVLGCYINPTHPDDSVREAETRRFIEHLKYARVLGADMVGTETGRYDADFKVVPYTYTEGNYQLLLKTMRQIVKAAEKLGVIVGVEAVHDHTLYCPEMMRRFLEDIDSPNVEAILDPVNLLSEDNYQNQDEVIANAFKLYGDRIGVLHIKDAVMDGGVLKFANVGEGLFHYEHLMKLVKEQKPHVAMLLEESNPKRCHRDIEFLEAIYEKA